MQNYWVLLWSSGNYRISVIDDALKIRVHCALLGFAIFFLEQQLSSFSRSVICSFKSLCTEVSADLEGEGIFRVSCLKGLSWNTVWGKKLEEIV